MSKLKDLIAEFCPDGVEFKPLGEIGFFFSGLNGKTKKDFSPEANAFFVPYMNVYKNLSVDFNQLQKVQIEKDERQNILMIGDVLFTGSSETLEECGISSVVTVTPEQNLYLNSFCFGFRLNDKNLLLPGFSKYIFSSTFLRKQITKTASGVTRFNVSKKKMEQVQIPIPPLPVQNEIVRILDKFTELTALLTEELKLRKKQYEYYRDKLLTFENVPMVKLGEIGKVSMCKRIMKNQTSESGEVPFYKIGTFGKTADAFISRELFEKYKSNYSYPKKGDILISAAGTIGRTVIFDGEPAYFQDSNIVWVANDETKVLNKFLYYLYQKITWQIQKGGTIARLYNDDISNAEIPIPPLAEQERIVNILDKFDKLCNDLCEGIPAEIAARKKQYEYYRDLLLTFEEVK